MQPVALAREIAQAVSVAAAYFEDTLAASPGQIWSAGPLGAERLGRILSEQGVGPEEGLSVRELVGSSRAAGGRDQRAAGMVVQRDGGAASLVKISVNLASRPFVELRPFFLRLRLLMGALALAAIALILTAHLLQGRLDDAQAEMDRLKARTAAAQQEKQSNERRMREPANKAVLDRAQFLNALFLRKSFSWTAVMMDLETVLPSGVQVTSIEPQIAKDGDVVIRLRVSGDRDRAVQLVRNLERSKRFLQPRLSGEAVQAREQGQQNLPA